VTAHAPCVPRAASLQHQLMLLCVCFKLSHLCGADSRAVVVGCASHLHVCVQAALAPTISITVHAAETTATGSTAAGEQDD
jgi:hypothetical protein